MSTSSATGTAPPEPDLTPNQLIQRAVELRPRLVEAQAEAEERTYYSPEMHKAFDDAGFYRLFIPRRYGGYEFDVPTFVRVLLELARGCVSTAWCMGLASGHALQVGSYFGERTQREVFGEGDFRAASVASPSVIAKRSTNGWVLNGTVGYCSGVPYSTHFMGQALPEGVPPDEAEGQMLLYVAPRSEWTMLDDWGDTLGLRGSGSHSIRFTDGRLPRHYVLERTSMVDVDVSDGTPGLTLHGNPVYCGRSLGVFTLSLAAIMVGGGYNALDEYENQMRTRKTPLPPMVPRIEDGDFQRWYGAAFGKLATAEAALLRCADEHAELCERTANGGEPYSAEDEQRVGVIAREIMVQVWETVEQDLFRSVGASTIRAGTRFERLYRDLSMCACHRNTAYRDPLYRRLAQLHLGIDAS
ncbi:MAG: acyl-CoA dehydrogenase [Pseudonocardiaceae bacterium]|nr:acyl-CoA dehydrogenase [Pseudonocardiaceae bacterium]